MHLKVNIFHSLLTLEGSIAVAGSAVKWARDQLGIIKSADEIGQLASKVNGISSYDRRLIKIPRV